jgi:hypothetical protein
MTGKRSNAGCARIHRSTSWPFIDGILISMKHSSGRSAFSELCTSFESDAISSSPSLKISTGFGSPALRSKRRNRSASSRSSSAAKMMLSECIAEEVILSDAATDHYPANRNATDRLFGIFPEPSNGSDPGDTSRCATTRALPGICHPKVGTHRMSQPSDASIHAATHNDQIAFDPVEHRNIW